MSDEKRKSSDMDVFHHRYEGLAAQVEGGCDANGDLWERRSFRTQGGLWTGWTAWELVEHVPSTG